MKRCTVLLALLAACGGSADPAALTDEGSAALNSSQYEDARASFEKALALMQPDDPSYLRAKMGAIEAQIYLDAEGAKTEFLDLAASSSAVGERDYRKVCSQMASAKKFEQAIDVLHAGIEKYGETDELTRRVEVLEARKA